MPTAVRDAFLYPDYPKSAQVAEQLYAAVTGQSVDGVIAITPKLIESMLQVTGPVAVPDFATTVTASNLQELIHYYHVTFSGGVDSSGQLQQQYGTSKRKLFDAELGSLLIHKVAELGTTQRGAVLHVMLDALLTHDLQVYFNDPHVEALLTARGLDSAVEAPRGDSLLIVDDNVGVTYSNADVTEYARDLVLLDAHGMATHQLTITYTFPVVDHLWSQVYTDTGGRWRYQDIMQVIVPNSATLVSQGGCDIYSPIGTVQPGHQTWSCEFVLWRPGVRIVYFTWTVAHAALSDHGALRYQVLLQRQPGAHIQVGLAITLPPSTQLAQALQPPLAKAPSGQIVYAALLLENRTLAVEYRTA
jgi:hypothetical protein